VKGNALRASSIGISVNARLVAIYTFAAFYAGVAGALLAQTRQARWCCHQFLLSWRYQ
jgi:branched-chain amino acid transport system permease protein